MREFDQTGNPPRDSADSILAGRFRLFEFQEVDAGFPPNWHRNPITGQETPVDRHWSRIGDFSSGDIKLIWEANRFASVYHLARAYWRTGHERFAEGFWTLVSDWQKCNPPNLGANWKCGQETSFRLMAWCFGLYAFLDSRSSTADRVANLAVVIGVSAERIAAHIDYALSQRNNHGISEAVGLFTAGVLFPEFSSSEKWKKTGSKILENLGRELIYDDGAFSQHSANYHRLMLHNYLWALRLGDLNGAVLSEELKRRIALSGGFLYQIQDEVSGQLPSFGQNDGALILPLNNCPPQSFKPVIQAIQYLADESCAYPPGPWNEDLLWLFGPRAVQSPVRPAKRLDFSAPFGGCWTLRSNDGFIFLRCPTFKDRPSHADSLHADIWWKGINVALDPGTFSYNAPKPWCNPLAHTQYHNTVTIDGCDQMERVGKFLWLPWLKGKAAFPWASRRDQPFSCWEGEHDGFGQLSPKPRHRRSVLKLPDETWLVMDQIEGGKSRTLRLHWCFPFVKHSWDPNGHLLLHFKEGDYHVYFGSNLNLSSTILTADLNSARGWRAPQYNSREPALSLEAQASGKSGVFWTILTPQKGSPSFSGQMLRFEAPHWSATTELSKYFEDSILIKSLEFHRNPSR